MRILPLVIYLKEDTNPEDVITDVNAAILCSLEEDKKTITGWKWFS